MNEQVETIALDLARPLLIRGHRTMNKRIGSVALALASLVAIAFGPIARAADAPITLDQLLSAPIPGELIAAPAGGRVAWVFNVRGRRNVWIAESAGERFTSRPLTHYTQDDGSDLGELAWDPSGETVIYTRGAMLKSSIIAITKRPNVASLPQGGPGHELWAVSVRSGAPRKLADGRAASVSPKGDLVAYLSGGQIWTTPLDGSGKPQQLIQDNGGAGAETFQQPPALKWSPDGARLAFVSQRGDHNFIGVYDFSRRSITWLAPSVDVDGYPQWAPDSERIAFIRIPSGTQGFPAARANLPWSIWIADAATGQGRAVWQAEPGPGSAFPSLDSPSPDSPLLWAADEQIVFPWEKTGWIHLYAVAARGGAARALTQGNFEVFSAELSADRRTVIYSANTDDSERRHLWKVPVAGGTAVALTSGSGSEEGPVVLSDGSKIAAIGSDGVNPPQPTAFETGKAAIALAPQAIPQDFPATRLIAPQAVSFPSADGLTLRGQLFLPPPSAGRKPRPALLFFHGGPHKQMLLSWGMSSEVFNYANCLYLASRGYVVLSVNYRGSTGYGLNFRTPDDFAVNGGSEARDVRAAAIYLGTRPDVDKKRIGSWGHSYGGMMTAQGLAHSSDLIAAGVDYAGLSNWRSMFIRAGFMSPGDERGAVLLASSPLGAIEKWRSPVLVIHPDDDRNAVFSQAVELIAGLRRNGVEFEQLVLPNEVHDPLMHRSLLTVYGAIEDFFARRLGCAESAQPGSCT